MSQSQTKALQARYVTRTSCGFCEGAHGQPAGACRDASGRCKGTC
jgi:hypothetical protein